MGKKHIGAPGVIGVVPGEKTNRFNRGTTMEMDWTAVESRLLPAMVD